MLIDDYLPRYDVVERHSISVRATQARTYAAICATDFATGWLIQFLFFVRLLPDALMHGREGIRALKSRRASPLTIATLQRGGFRLLAERAPDEMLLGTEGKFWTLSGERGAPTADAFRDGAPEAGTARGVWDFRVRAKDHDHSELTTETRVLCADSAARRRFLPYWTVIRPGSGLIRRVMLRAIKQTAERASA
ncbi:MAG: hypothetical protein ABJE10_15200 [bacterium]